MKKLLGLMLLFTGCASVTEESLYSAMKKNPQKFMQALRETAEAAQKVEMESMVNERDAQMEKDLKNPRPVIVDNARLIFGNANAPVTIVKYADFQCPACRMGYLTLEEIKKKYAEKIKVIHKNIPLPMHPQAPLAAEIYESMLIVDKNLAKKFYNKAYETLGQWGSDDKVWKMAQGLGIKKSVVVKEIAKGVVEKRLQEDLDEHQRLGFQGTPMYMVNGVAMEGAPNFQQMAAVIEKVLKK
jgi:protein-disulfide isomerase